MAQRCAARFAGKIIENQFGPGVAWMNLPWSRARYSGKTALHSFWRISRASRNGVVNHPGGADFATGARGPASAAKDAVEAVLHRI